MVCPAARAAGQTHCHIGRLAPDKLPIAYTPAFAAAFRPCVYRGTHRMTPNAGRSQPVTAERGGEVTYRVTAAWAAPSPARLSRGCPAPTSYPGPRPATLRSRLPTPG